MNRLELVNRLRQEAGVAGNGPVTTQSHTGELGRLVSWIDQAYQDIQDRRSDWDFLRHDFDLLCTIGVSTYPRTSVPNLAEWKIDSLRIYQNSTVDELWMTYIPWETFRDSRLRGANRTVQGRPYEFSIKPDKSLVIWPTPDQAYTVDGECFYYADVMTLDTSIPLFDRYQHAIVYNALKRYGAWSSDPACYARGESEYKRLIRKLEFFYAPNLTLAGPMA